MASSRPHSDGRQIEKGSESLWDAEQLDRHQTRWWGTPIALQPLLPGKAIVRPLRAGQGQN